MSEDHGLSPTEDRTRGETDNPQAASVAHLSPRHLPFLLTVEEVAAWLRTTPKAIYALKERGRLAGAVQRGRRLLVRRDDLLASLVEVGALSRGHKR